MKDNFSKKEKRQIEKQKFINRVLMHNRTVTDLMILLEINREKLNFDIKEWEILNRGISHDFDKFNENFANMIVGIYTDEITDEKEIEEKQKNCHDHHAINSHHLKYHEINNIPFSNLDICEICCDLIAGLKKPRFSNLNFKNYREMIENYVENPENNGLLEKYKDKFLTVADLLDELKEN